MSACLSRRHYNETKRFLVYPICNQLKGGGGADFKNGKNN